MQSSSDCGDLMKRVWRCHPVCWFLVASPATGHPLSRSGHGGGIVALASVKLYGPLCLGRSEVDCTICGQMLLSDAVPCKDTSKQVSSRQKHERVKSYEVDV